MFFASMWLIGRIIENGLMWVLPAAVVVSFSLLLYARHWGRFAWLSLNFLPRYLRGTQLAKPKAEAATEAPPPAPLPKEAAPKKIPVPKPNPEPEAEAVAASVLNEGVREGLPPQYATGIQTATPGTPQSVVAGPPPASPVPVDEFTYDPAPYEVADVPGLPTFAEAAAPAPMPVAAATTAPIATVEEEEDEWSTNKKPYDVGAPVVPLPKSDVPPPEPTETDEDLNAPVTLSQYYDDKAEKDAEEARRREEEKRKMPPLSKKTPTFVKALITGVWNFVVYPSTLVAWLNLAVITFVELFIFWMLVMFNPFKGGGGN
jgi:hypothetical protein